MQYVPHEEGIEVRGSNVGAIVQGFASFKKIPSDILLRLGIGRPGKDGLVEILPDEWIPQGVYLRGFAAIGDAVGLGALYGIGLKIPDFAVFPSWVEDVDSALRSIDIAYHLNHRKAGRLMFDEATGVMMDGIGNYRYARARGENRGTITCSDPFPCDFDRGIVTSMARRFAAEAWVDHVGSSNCRKNGGKECVYMVTWRER